MFERFSWHHYRLDGFRALLRNLCFAPYGLRRESDRSKDAITTTLAQIQRDQDIYGGRGFTGHEHLDHTGIIHMNGRIFDPRLGRFLQPDPIVQSPIFPRVITAPQRLEVHFTLRCSSWLNLVER